MSAPSSNARRVACSVLLRSETPGDFLEHRLDSDPAYRALSGEDRRLARELASGVLRQRAALDWLIAQKTGGRNQRTEVQIVLRLGAYQLYFLDRIPDHAAVHETVSVARSFGLNAQSGFVNAVLRGLTRDRESLRAGLEQLRQVDPAIGWSHPKWLIERWSQNLTPPELQAFLLWNNTPPKTFARVNRLRTEPGALLHRWTEEGVEVSPQEFPWARPGTVFELKSHPALESLPSFREGGFYIQDPSTLLAVSVLGVKNGNRVLDYCAAPGGKTSLIAEELQGSGELVATDSSVERRDLLLENSARLGLTRIRVAATQDAGMEFDRVLVDAPCSNTGVLRRRVELRWRISPDEIARLARLQAALLDEAAARVRIGGFLVYSTCSIDPDENESVAHGFVSRNPGFRLDSMRSLHPARDGVDGAFCARLERIA
jgi:16S rRNA (cytosine967-C5)-methyltransferase